MKLKKNFESFLKFLKCFEIRESGNLGKRLEKVFSVSKKSIVGVFVGQQFQAQFKKGIVGLKPW